MANTVGRRSASKYKEGQEVTGRILEVDSSKKRVSMTLKKLLCGDKLRIITTFQVHHLGLLYAQLLCRRSRMSHTATKSGLDEAIVHH